MAWIELHDTLPEHPKVELLAEALGIEEAHAVGLLACMWTWSLRYSPDGNLSNRGARGIARGAKWHGDPEAFVTALKACGLLDEAGNIHDWYEYAGRLLERREQQARRSQVHRYKLRLPVYERDNGQCQYCGVSLPITAFMVDHIIPLKQGGENSPQNLVTACPGCNNRKGNRTPEEAGMPIINDPRKSPRNGDAVNIPDVAQRKQRHRTTPIPYPTEPNRTEPREERSLSSSELKTVGWYNTHPDIMRLRIVAPWIVWKKPGNKMANTPTEIEPVFNQFQSLASQYGQLLWDLAAQVAKHYKSVDQMMNDLPEKLSKAVKANPSAAAVEIASLDELEEA